jgi:hypothetical protein
MPRYRETALVTPGLFLTLLPFILIGALVKDMPDWVLFAFVISLFCVVGFYIMLVEAAIEVKDENK